MIYGFVRQSNGQIRVHSELGKGTTMSLYLPRHQGEPTDSETARKGMEGFENGYGETVLVIDDEPTRAAAHGGRSGGCRLPRS